ncbi:MAG TPA: sensor histidine kinase [Solirubrobacterales bacterium]|jgi:anti-sigma regulatory factor (Ser/Thr protein kinase)|nr:sensor histidine kinase [Solirubrobacterales bacterium]
MKQPGFQHEALIYEGSDEYLAVAIPFLRAGLEADQPALVAVGPDQTALLQRELGAEAERVRFADMREVGRNPAAIIPIWREFVDAAGGRPVRGIGEPVWAARSAAALEECHRHESLLNVVFDDGPAWWLLCPYDAGSLDDEVLDKVGQSHPRVCRDGVSEESVSYVLDVDCFAGRLPQPLATAESFDFQRGELAEVRHRVAAAAERAGMDAGGAADLVTAASELAANSVVHGGGSGTLRLWPEEERLLAEVEDRGRIVEPLVGRVRPDAAQEGGRGLWLANQLCDLVQIRSGAGGTTVRLHALAREAAYV